MSAMRPITLVNAVLRHFSARMVRIDESPGTFSHGAAQRYEFASAEGTIRQDFPALYAAWEKSKEAGELWSSAGEWIADRAEYEGFLNHVRTRKCLEVGAGPFGVLPLCDYIKDRVVIDPLAHEYRRVQLQVLGKTFYEAGLKIYAKPAEEFIPELKGAVDGAIISRNALDHTDDPLAILANRADYAARGCYLLLWSEIWHLDGCDEGHRNITRSHRAMDALLTGLGFDIAPPGSFQRNNPGLLDFGCVARKR